MSNRVREILRAFIGATASVKGHTGLVPAPAAGDESKFLKADGTWGTPSGGGTISRAIITDEKSLSTDGGTFTSGAWRTRDLNTEVTDLDGIVTISSNQFTLGAGTYTIEWSAPGFACLRHQTQLYDVTGTAAVQRGSVEYSDLPFGSVSAQTRSMGIARVSPSGSNTYEIQHYCGTTRSTDGFGHAGSLGSGGNEVYTIVTIIKWA